MSKYNIPLIVHQTFYTTSLPIEIINIITHNQKMCPNYKFYFYNDDQCEEFIKNNFDTQVYNAYMKLNKHYGAMKADFFRYCVLFKLGGVYLDIKSKINKPLGTIIKPDDICILDKLRNYLEPWRKNNPTYEQWLLIFSPYHPYLSQMIKQMVNDIENNYEPKISGYSRLTPKQKVLMLTGPDAFTRAINSYIRKYNIIEHRTIDYNWYFQIHQGNYLKMYKNKKHYSEVNLPLYNS